MIQIIICRAHIVIRGRMFTMLDPHGQSLTSYKHAPAEAQRGHRRAAMNAARNEIADMGLGAMEKLRDFLDRQQIKISIHNLLRPVAA